MQGFLNLNKPNGFTSHDCVAKVRRLLRLKRVGHGGTLDPAATGVLPIALGKATRLLQYLQSDKAYQGTIRLGVRTTTDDLEGEVVATQSASGLTLETVLPLLEQFQGKIKQVPPIYSAIQVQGKRLYDLARAGEVAEVPERTVEVYRIEVLDWRPGEFPELDVAIACGGGTYIRAIARDLGTSLKTGGVLAALTRTHSSGFPLADSLTLEQLEEQVQAGRFNPIPPAVPLSYLPKVTLAASEARRWCLGQRIVAWDAIANLPTSPLRVHHEDGHFLGIGEIVGSEIETLVAPVVVLETAHTP
ncbi:MAG TPA: tRNA pseudouridine(55) synthase TruB [Cyanobacteria bacterium UBA8803]|nr:tRNA pseudouridine(55) synthase TruB [Cyanobacteria bacterium UBA9273]HBL62378.1 tRNA pseudouridine(55) synthase TruB [Cyanobacteria bacterium UBA8803]